jgi:HEAT repeat protein
MRYLLFAAVVLSGFAGLAPAEEYVYEGRPAAEWAKELKAAPDNAQAQHALTMLGKDAVPALVPLLRDPDIKIRAAAAAVIGEVKPGKDAVEAFLPLLKDEHFEVRRTAIRALGRFVPTHPAVAAAIRGALEDRDKAVAEAAEEALAANVPAEQIRRQKDCEALLEEAAARRKAGKFDEALALLKRAREMPRDDPRLAKRVDAAEAEVAEQAAAHEKEARRKAVERAVPRAAERGEGEGEREREKELPAKADGGNAPPADAFLKQAQILVTKGDIEGALRVAKEAERAYPDDERLRELRKRIETKKEADARREREGGERREDGGKGKKKPPIGETNNLF